MLEKDRFLMNTNTMRETSKGENFSGLPKVTNGSGKDAAFAIYLSRRFLMILGVWRPENCGKFSWRLVLANVSVIVCYYGIAIRLIPTSLYIVIDATDIYQMLILMSRALFCVMTGMKYVLLRLHRNDIKKCMEHVEADWLGISSTSEREAMVEYSRYGHFVTKLLAGFTFSGATWFAILPFVLNNVASSSTSENTTVIVSVRKFAVPSHFGVSVASQTPIYEIIYTSQVIATFMLHTISIACYSLAVVVVMHACGQLKILVKIINELIDSEDKSTSFDSFNGRLSNAIRHHTRALRFISSAEKMLRGICFLDLGGCTVQLCCLAYFTLLEFRAEKINPVGVMVYGTLFVTFMFNIFSFCYIGDLLTQESVKIGETIYMTEWHRLPAKKSLVLCLIIARAQSPLTLTAAGAIQLSFRCFASVIKTSMGYFNMLRTITE